MQQYHYHMYDKCSFFLPQIPEDKRRSEEDLDSRWEEEMKATELTQPAPVSHSSGHPESDTRVNSETVKGINCQHSEHISPQVGMEAKSQMTSASVCSSTTDSHGQPVDVRRKRGRPRKIKPLLTKDKKDPDSAGLDAVQHKEISTTIPLPTCLENHNSVDVPNVIVESPSINNAPHNELSGPQTVSDGKVEDNVPLLPKRKRGRPRKTEMAAFKTMVSKSAAAPSVPTASSNANNVIGSTRRLRSRGEQHPLSQDGKTESNSKVNPKQTEMTPSERSNALNFQGIKRRRAKPADQQVPAKVSRLDVSHEASSVLSNDTGFGEGAETDKQVELNTDKQETDTDGKGDQLSLQCGEIQKHQTDLKDSASSQKRLPSLPAAKPEVIPSEVLDNLNLVNPSQSDDPEIKQSADINCREESQQKSSPESQKNANLQNTEPSSTDVVTSSEQPPKPDWVPPAVKAENIEIELNHLNPVSESNSPKSLQHNANTTVKSEGPNSQRNTFRRKRGGKRRRTKA